MDQAADFHGIVPCVAIRSTAVRKAPGISVPIKIICLIILVCLISVFGNLVYAQKILTLEEAINIALKNSLEIELEKNYVEANTELNNYGYAGGLPLVTGSVNDNQQITDINQKLSNGTNIKRRGATGNNLTANITGSMLLYNGMRVKTTKQRLAQLQQQSQEYLNARIQNIIADVMINYYDIVRQQNYLLTLDQSIEVSRQRLSLIETKESVGLANNADLFQTQLDLNQLLQTRSSQVLVIEQAKTNLLTQLTLKPDSLIVIADTIIVDQHLLLQNILEKLPTNHEVIAAVRQVRINELIEKETAALRYPSLRLNTGYNFNLSKSSGGFNLYNESYGPFM